MLSGTRPGEGGEFLCLLHALGSSKSFIVAGKHQHHLVVVSFWARPGARARPGPLLHCPGISGALRDTAGGSRGRGLGPGRGARGLHPRAKWKYAPFTPVCTNVSGPTCTKVSAPTCTKVGPDTLVQVGPDTLVQVGPDTLVQTGGKGA